jgi:hypothetical protein
VHDPRMVSPTAMLLHIIALLPLPCCSPALAAEPVPAVPKGTPYSVARRLLITMGYQPEPVPAMRQRCAPERAEICRAYAEAERCSGGARSACTFLWRGGESLVEVGTTGEDELVVDRLRCRAACG